MPECVAVSTLGDSGFTDRLFCADYIRKFFQRFILYKAKIKQKSRQSLILRWRGNIVFCRKFGKEDVYFFLWKIIFRKFFEAFEEVGKPFSVAFYCMRAVVFNLELLSKFSDFLFVFILAINRRRCWPALLCPAEFFLQSLYYLYWFFSDRQKPPLDFGIPFSAFAIPDFCNQILIIGNFQGKLAVDFFDFYFYRNSLYII